MVQTGSNFQISDGGERNWCWCGCSGRWVTAVGRMLGEKVIRGNQGAGGLECTVMLWEARWAYLEGVGRWLLYCAGAVRLLEMACSGRLPTLSPGAPFSCTVLPSQHFLLRLNMMLIVKEKCLNDLFLVLQSRY